MIKNLDLETILALPVKDRLAIADAILQSLEDAADDQPVPEWQLHMLRQRIAQDDKHQGPGETWDQFKRRSACSFVFEATRSS